MKENIIILVVMLFITFILLWKRKLELSKSLAFTVYFLLSMWVNIPVFISLSSESLLQNPFVNIPFNLMQQFGILYILFANIVLSILLHMHAIISDNTTYNYKEVKKQYDDFGDDASELYIIGRDLDFLGKKEFNKQTNRIIHLRNKCNLLCEHTSSEELIRLYRQIQETGVQIRSYEDSDNITSLKGQIKVDHSGSKKAIFMMKSNKRYLLIKLDNQFLIESILERFRKIFAKSDNISSYDKVQ